VTSNSQARQCAIRFAIKDLLVQGYNVDRCSGKNRTFDLIAWSRGVVLGLLIKTARKPAITVYHTDVSRLSELAKKNQTPGKTEIWLYHPGGRIRYHVLPGGAMVMKEDTS